MQGRRAIDFFFDRRRRRMRNQVELIDLRLFTFNTRTARFTFQLLIEENANEITIGGLRIFTSNISKNKFAWAIPKRKLLKTG